MADRYWVGGSGTWNTTSTTNWSATSGGAGGASVPTTADNVIFDQAGTYTVTMTGGLNCLNFTVSAGTVTFATGTTPTLTVAGSMSLITGTVWNSTGTITFSSTGAKSITSAGTVFSCSITITGAGGTFTFNDNLTLNSARTFTLTNGTLNLGTYTLSTGIFSSANSNTRAINFSTGKIVLTGNTTSTIWDLGTSTNCTTSGSQLVEITGGGGSAVTKTISGGTTTSAANSVNISILDGAGTNYTFTNGHNIKSLIVAPSTGGVTINNNSITFFGSFTNTDFYGGAATFAAGTGTWTFQATSGLQTITTDGAIFDNPFTINAAGATYSLSDSFTTGSTRTFTLTAGNLNLNGFTLSAGIFSSNNSNSRSINFSNDGQIVLTGNNTTIFDTGVSATNFSTTGTPYIRSTYAGATGTRTFSSGVSLAQSSGYSVYTSGTTGIVIGTSATDTVALTGNYDNIDLTGLTNTISNTARTVYGNFTVPASGGTLTSGTAVTTFAASSSKTITTNGRTVDFPLTFNGVGGTWVLQDNLELANTRLTTLTAGTLDLNNYVLTTGTFDSSNSNVRSINFGTGKIVLNSSAATTIWNSSTTTNFTVSGTPLVECQGSGTGVTKAITPGSPAEANTISFSLLETSGTVTYNISTSNIRNLLINGSQTYALVGSTPTIYGSFTHLTTNGTTTITSTSGTFIFAATSDVNTITTPAGFTYDFAWTFNGAGGTWQLQSNVTLGSTRTLTLTAGTLSLNNYTFTANILSSSNSNLRTLAFGTSGQLALTGNNATIVDFTTATNFTFSGTPYINSTYTGATGTRTFNFGGTAGASVDNVINVACTGTNGIVIGSTATDTVALTGAFDSVNLTGLTATLSNTVRTIYGDFTVPSTGGTISTGTNTTTLVAPSLPVANGYSAFFDGSGDNLNTPNNAALTLAGGDFTLEAWVYTTGAGSFQTIIAKRGGAGREYQLWLDSGSRQLSCSDSSATNFISSQVVPLNTWSHVAVSVEGSGVNATARLFYNGTLVFTTTAFDNSTQRNQSVSIGSLMDGTQSFGGYISNVRITKGVALYTSNFTPATSPLTASANTSLLTCQNNTFVDNSGNNFPLTVSGSTSASTASPFATTPSTNTANTNGRLLDFPITVGDSVNSGTVQLASALTLGSTRTLTLGGGTFDLVSYTATTGLFNSSNAITRTLAFGTGKIVLNSATTSTVWTTATVTNLTVTGTPLVECIGGGTAVTKTINTGTLSEANSISFSLLETTGTATYAFTASNAVRNLTLNGAQTVSNIAITIYGDFTHLTSGGTTTLTAGANAWTFGSTSATLRTLLPAAVTYGFPWTFNGVGGSWQLNANLALSSTVAFTLANGTFDFDNFTVTGPTSGITINGGTVSIINTAGALTTTLPVTHTAGSLTLTQNFTTSAASGYTFTAGTLNLGSYTLTTPIFNTNTSNVRTLAFGTGKIVLNGSVTATIWVMSSPNMTVTGTPLVECIGGGSAVTKTIQGAALSEANSISFSLLETTGSVTYTFTASSAVRNLTVNGVQTISNIAITIYGNFLHQTSNGTTTFTAGANAWTFGATSGTKTITTPAVTYDFPWTFNGTGGTWQLQNNIALGSTRAFTLTNGTFDFNSRTLTGPTSGITILTGSVTITNTGGTFTTALPFTHTSGTLTLAVNVTTSSATGYTLTAGTLALSTFTLTAPVFSSSNANTRSINFGTGKIVLNASTTSTIWNMATLTGFTVSGTPLVECIGGGTAITKTITPGTATEAQSISFSLLETTGTVTYTITTATSNVRNLLVNGSQTLSNSNIGIWGSFTHQTTNGTTTFTAGTNAWIFAATSGTYNINNISGFTYDWPWTFGNAASTATWQLQNNLTLGATRQLTLVNGTTDFNSKTLSAAGITILTGAPTISNTGTGSFTTTLPITHTSGTLTLTNNLTTSSATGYTFTAGTLALGTFTLTVPVFSSSNSNARTINFGTGKIVLTRNATATIWDTATSTNMTTTGTPLVECQGGGTAVTKTINAGSGITEANTISFSLLETTGTVTYTISASSRIRNLLVNGVQTISNTSFDIFGSFTHLNSNGTTTFTAGTNILNFRATSGNHTINPLAGFTYDFPWQVGNATASTAVWTLTGNMALGATRIFYFAAGIFDFNTYMVTAGSQFYLSIGTMRLRNTGGATITTTLPVTIDASGGSLILEANFTTTAAGNAVTLTVGTLNLNDFVLTARVLSGTGSGIRSIAFGTSGQIAITGNNATVLEFSTMGNFTYTGNPYINLSYTGATGTRTMNMGVTSGATATNTFNVATSGTSGIVIGTAATDTVALAGYYNDINLTGLTNTISNTITFLYGNLTVPSTGGTLTAGGNPWTFVSTAARTITTNGRTLDFPMTFNGVGGSWTLQSSLTLGSTRLLTLTAGTIGLNDFLLTANSLSSSNSNTRAINFGTTGQITLAGNAATIVDLTTMTGFTYTGTPRIYSSYSGATGTRTFNIGGTAGATANNVFSVAIGTSGTGIVINAGTDSVALTGSYNNIDFTGLTQTVTNTVTNIYGGLTVPASGGSFTAGANTWSFLIPSSTSVITTNGRTLDFPITIGTSTSTGTAQLASAMTMGSTRALTVTGGTLDLNNFTLTAGTLSSTNSNRRTLAFGSSGGITLAASTTTVVDMTIMTNFTRTGTPYINSTGTGARSYIFGSSGGAFPDNVFNVSRTGSSGLVIGTGIDSITLTGSFGDIDFTGLTQTITNTARTAYGNLTVPAASGTLTAGGAVTTVSAPATVVTDGYSIALNGSTDFLSLAGNSVFAIPTSTTPFTIECWVYPLANGGCIFSEQYTTGANSISIAISMSNGTDMDGGTNGRTVCFGWFTGAAWVTAAGANTALELSAWTHVACVFTGSTTKIYYNGVDVTKTATPTPSTTWGITNVNGDSWYIGRRWDATGTPYFNGYISNFRFTRGVAVYTENFTPSTSPLTTTSQGVSATDVSLLTCQAPSFVDNSLNNLTVTRNGSASVAQRSPFSSTQTTKTITTNGRTLDFPVTIGDSISGPGITQMTGALTLGSTRSLTLTATTMDLNDFTATANAFSANGIVPRTLSFDNTGQLTLSGSNVTVISMPTATNFTMTGNNKIVSSYTGATGTRTFALGNAAGFTVAGNTEANNMFNFNINGTQGIVISGGTDTLAVVGQVRDFDLRGTTNIVTNQVLSVYGNFYTSASGGTINAGANTLTLSGYSGNFVIDTANRALDFPVTVNGNGNYSFANNYTLGTSVPAYTRPFTLTAGNLTLNNVTLFCNSFVSNSSSVRSLNFPGTTGAINLTANGTTVWNSNNGANFSTSGNIIINSTYTGSTGTRVFDFGNIAEASAPNVKVTTGTVGFNIGTAGDSVTLTGSIGELNLTGLLATVTNSSRTVYGNVTISPPIAVDYLVVAGGGGSGVSGGGGGGGGLLSATSVLLTPGTTYTITVGGGGTAGTAPPTTAGSNGSNSSIAGTGLTTVLSYGGGLGGYYTPSSGISNGSNGGSGGGAPVGGGGQNRVGGKGVYPGSTFVNAPRQGYDGGNNWAQDGQGAGGGGGGAGAAGATATAGVGGAGGAGAQSSITGTATYYAGGGGGSSTTGGAGGLGGGGAGSGPAAGVAGTTNSGGGGGGGGTTGGSGIVVIRWPDTLPAASAVTGSPTVTVTGGYRIYTFTGSGTITIGGFAAGAAGTTFASTAGTKTIDTANAVTAFPMTFNGVGGNWTLANGLTANATTVLTLANGAVNFNQQALTFANITIAGGATGNAGLSNLNTTLSMVHTSGNLTILSGAINSATTNSYTLTSGTLNVSANFSTGAFTNNGGNIIL